MPVATCASPGALPANSGGKSLGVATGIVPVVTADDNDNADSASLISQILDGGVRLGALPAG